MNGSDDVVDDRRSLVLGESAKLEQRHGLRVSHPEKDIDVRVAQRCGADVFQVPPDEYGDGLTSTAAKFLTDVHLSPLELLARPGRHCKLTSLIVYTQT